jgi:hypothetical protein
MSSTQNIFLNGTLSTFCLPDGPGLPNGYIFKPKILSLGKFWKDQQWKSLVYFMAIWIFYGHLVYFQGH